MPSRQVKNKNSWLRKKERKRDNERTLPGCRKKWVIHFLYNSEQNPLHGPTLPKSYIKRKVLRIFFLKRKNNNYSEFASTSYQLSTTDPAKKVDRESLCRTGACGALASTAVTWREAELHYLDHSSTDDVSLVEIIECLACLFKFVFPRNSTGKIEDTAFCQFNQLGKILPCPCSIGANHFNLFHDIERVKV